MFEGPKINRKEKGPKTSTAEKARVILKKMALWGLLPISATAGEMPTKSNPDSLSGKIKNVEKLWMENREIINTDKTVVSFVAASELMGKADETDTPIKNDLSLSDDAIVHFFRNENIDDYLVYDKSEKILNSLNKEYELAEKGLTSPEAYENLKYYKQDYYVILDQKEESLDAEIVDLLTGKVEKISTSIKKEVMPYSETYNETMNLFIKEIESKL